MLRKVVVDWPIMALTSLAVRLAAIKKGHEQAVYNAYQSDRSAARGTWASALMYAKVAVASDPSWAYAYRTLARAYKGSGKIDESREALRQASRLDPNDHRFLWELGNLEYDLENWQEAEVAYEEALTLKPDEAGVRVGLSLVLEAQNRLDDGVSVLREGLRTLPNNARLLVTLGALLEKQGNLSEAEQVARRAIAEDPELAVAHYCLASVLEGMERWEEAKSHAAYALMLQPSYQDAKKLLQSLE